MYLEYDLQGVKDELAVMAMSAPEGISWAGQCSLTGSFCTVGWWRREAEDLSLLLQKGI